MLITSLTEQVVFTADCQLKRRTWANRTNINDDPIYGLRQVVDHAIENRADLVIAGDFFDTKSPDTITLRQAAAEIQRLKDTGLRAIGIVGNHDMATGLTETGDPATGWYSFVGIEAANKLVLRFAGKDWYALDWQADPKAALVEMPAGCTGLILHQLFEGIVPTYMAANISTTDIPAGVTHVLVGDFHERFVRLLDGVEIHSPGPTYLCKLDEHPTKACTLLSGDSAGGLIYHDLPLKTRQVVRCTVNDDAELQATIDLIRQVNEDLELPEAQKLSILHVKWHPSLKNVEPRIKAACPDNIWPVLERLILDADGNVVEAKPGLDHDDRDFDPDEVLHKVMDRREDAEAYDFTLGLLRSDNPTEYIRNYRATMGVERVV